jgi:hypothetical protein
MDESTFKPSPCPPDLLDDGSAPLMPDHERIDALERELRAARLSLKAVLEENRLLRQRPWSFPAPGEDIPWRVVELYRRLRPLFPTRVLKATARIVDRLTRPR